MERRLEPLRPHQRAKRQQPADDEARRAPQPATADHEPGARLQAGQGHQLPEERYAHAAATLPMRRRQPEDQHRQRQQQRQP
jgi:hypothetical protein